MGATFLTHTVDPVKINWVFLGHNFRKIYHSFLSRLIMPQQTNETTNQQRVNKLLCQGIYMHVLCASEAFCS